MTISDITAHLDAWAPPGQKADFDRVGLHVGDASNEVHRVLVALDLTPQVIAEASDLGAGLIVTHHPLLFKPVGRVTADDPVGGLVLMLAQQDLAHYAIHTNLDAAWGGVSFALAEQLGLEDLDVLAPLDGAVRKITTYVPPSHADAVRDALADAGAGQIGAYRACSFTTEGTGRFEPLADATPAIGEAGGPRESVREERIEAVVPSWRLPDAITGLAAAHPYEQPVVDVTALLGPASRTGYGALGTLPAPEALPGFLDRVAACLGAGALRYVGDDAAIIRQVAVCGGSGMSFFEAARRARADAYVTADVTYHRFFEALGPNGMPAMALVDAGHYETEAVTEQLIADRLRAAFPDLPVHVTRHRTSPMRTFTRE